MAWIRYAAISVAVVAALSCSNEGSDEPAPGRGVRSVEQQEASSMHVTKGKALQPRRSSGRAAPSNFKASRTTVPAEPTNGPTRGAVPEDNPLQEEEAPSATDAQLGAALRALVGNPADCLPANDGVGTVTLTLHATVVPSGRVTRVDVGPGTTPRSAVRCLETRVIGKRLPTDGSTNGPRTLVERFVLDWQTP